MLPDILLSDKQKFIGAGETGKHRMVSRSSVPAKASSKAVEETDAQTKVEASRPSERSWLSGLWSSGVQYILFNR